MGRLIKQLFDGPLDVIGDIHGEREALEKLLAKLGYDHEGRHANGRRLIFVGDLCDRGPDSPGVIRIVQALVESGRAQMVAGNHELNLLRGERKHGNHWFYGVASHPEFGDSVAISTAEQEPILSFLRSLPIALERPDLRIVHAAWIEGAIEQCRNLDVPLDAAYQLFDRTLHQGSEFRAIEARYEEEMARLGAALKDPNVVPATTAVGPYDEFCQMGNPIRVITSGVERVTDKPFFASGKWRFVDRVAWWHEYESEIPVLFGHYWRWWDPAVHPTFSKGEPQLFADDPVGPFMADHHRAFCVDFSAGSRYKQRRLNHEPPFHGRLAAMRWPERELVYDADAPEPLQLADVDAP
jgi:hypothetical protein